MKRPSRIFVGPQEIAGYYAGLAFGFRALGHDCDYVTFAKHPFGYGGGSRGSVLVRTIAWLNGHEARNVPAFLLVRAVLAAIAEALAAMYVCVALLRYDVFVFGFGRSLLRLGIDLPLLRWFGKKVIMNMGHGSELRPPYIDGSYQSSDGVRQPTPLRLKWISRAFKLRMRLIERYASYVIGAPLSSTQFAEKPMINSTAFGLPCSERLSATAGGREDFGDSNAMHRDGRDGPIRVLHSPSHPATKGSQRIGEAIERLRCKGYDIEFVELRGRPNQEVLQEIRNCDFVVDQIYSDTPMAGFAAEAAWYGRPAVVGGYGLDYLKRFVPDGMFPPSLVCHPDGIESAMEQMVTDPRFRLELGAQARDFVRARWSAEEVAAKYLRLMEDDIPHNWWFDPKDVTYLHGCGLPESQAKKNVHDMVSKYGLKSLQLSHRPGLEKAFLAFSGLDS